MTGSVLAFALAVLASSGRNPGWPSGMDALRKAWKLAPADDARKGLLECRKLSDGTTRVLVRADSSRDGSVKSLEWTAETGVHGKDLPDETFWAILDGTSDEAEWTETDPDALPKAFLKALGEPPSQGFLCRACKPRLAAATFSRHGATGLRVAPLAGPAPALSAALASGVTEEGIRFLAAQRKLSLDAANPCSDKSGTCSFELSGPSGQKWTISRRDGKSAWNKLDASYQSGPWWSPDWDWDSLRIHSPHEFQTMVGAWIGSEADLLAERLLAPVEPVLAFPVSSWKTRELPGLRIQQTSDEAAKQPHPPTSLLLARSDRFEAKIDAFGRRTISIGEPSR